MTKVEKCKLDPKSLASPASTTRGVLPRLSTPGTRVPQVITCEPEYLRSLVKLRRAHQLRKSQLKQRRDISVVVCVVEMKNLGNVGETFQRPQEKALHFAFSATIAGHCRSMDPTTQLYFLMILDARSSRPWHQEICFLLKSLSLACVHFVSSYMIAP